jgi:hypothetical protein
MFTHGKMGSLLEGFSLEDCWESSKVPKEFQKNSENLKRFQGIQRIPGGF